MKAKLYLILTTIAFIEIPYGLAQIGGKYTYDFLSMPVSARITGLGGIALLVKDDDVNLASANPALLNDKMNGSIAFNHNFHFAGISNGHFALAKKVKGMNYHIGFTYFSYGDFNATNEFGEVTGSFKASERAVVVGTSRKLNERIDAGVNLRAIFSSLENYKSIGLASDLAINYNNEDKNFCATILVKNFGGELSSFTDSNLSAPLDIQIGFSKRLKHLPLRFSIFAHQLQQWNIRYDNPNEVKETDLFGVTNEPGAFSKSID